MASDGSIKITIDIDGKQIEVATKALDRLEAAANKTGKGVKTTETSIDGLASSSSKASKDVKNTADSVDGLASSGNKASKDLKNADDAIDGVANSSADATKDVKGTAEGIDNLADSGSKASKGLKDADSAIDDVASSSSSATKDVGNAAESIDGLGESGSRAERDLSDVDRAIDNLGDSSNDASRDIGDVSGSLDDLGSSGDRASADVSGADNAIDNLGDSARVADGSIDGARDSLNELGSGANNAANNVREADDALDGVDNGSRRAGLSIKELAISMGLVAIASKAFNVMKSALDGAISRFDTLAGFPVVMELMGFSSEEAEKSISKLSDGIQGLPTTLNGIVASTQNIALLTGDLEDATDTALALNNAFLASGSSAMDAERGLVQYVQMLSKGEVDITSWRTLQETMGYALNKAAEGFGYAGESAQNDFYRALKNGDVVFKDFNAKLIELNNEAGGFAETAAISSAGIATSIGNLRNAATVGVANIITSFDKLSQATTGKSIAENLDSLKAIVSSSFKIMGSVIEGAAPTVIVFSNAIKATTPIVKALMPAIIGLMSAYAAYTVITKVTAAIKASNAVLIAAQSSQTALTLATTLQTAAQARLTGSVTASNLIIGLMTRQITFASAAVVIKTAATYAWGAALRFLAGPVGWIVAGIGLLVTGVIAVVKWFNKASDEGAKLNTKNEELAASTDAVRQAVEDSSAAHEKNIGSVETNADAYKQLAKQAEELAAKDKLSAEEKKTLNSYIDELNRNVTDLNLVYGEESKALSASSEQIANRIELSKEEEKLHASQERLTEIIKEQIEVSKGLEETSALRQEWNEKLEDGSVKSREHKKALKELDEQEKILMETGKLAGEEKLRIDEEIKASSKAVADAEQENVGRSAKMMEELSEVQKNAVEGMKETWNSYRESATNMFDRMEEKSTISIGKMTANLEENQRIIGKWADNIATLAERGVDEGLLETLRAAGPSSAGHVNELVNASDKELERLSTAFSEGGNVATDALVKSLGLEKSGIPEEVEHLVIGTKQSLESSIKSANFEGVGGDVTDGFAKGVNDGSEKGAKATENMAKDAIEAATGMLEVKSPSRVFKRIGGDITDGLAIGIDGGAGRVTTAIQNMLKKVQADSTQSFNGITKGFDSAVKQIEASLSKLPIIMNKSMNTSLTGLKSSAKSQMDVLKTISKGYDESVKNIDRTLSKLAPVTQKSMMSMITAIRSGSTAQISTLRNTAQQSVASFANMPSQFSYIGVNAMAGLNAGLNAGSGRVLATARNIANRVASTMKSALKIHSPSRLMRDDIGKMIPAGIAVGIEENAKTVYRALDDLNSGLMLSATPEVALGVGSASFAHATSLPTQVAQAVTEHKHNTTNMDGLFSGANFHVRNDSDIAKIAKELNDYITKKARGNGVVIT